MSEILDVVNENDEIIGQAERDEVHRIGLVCRLVYVLFYTPDGKVILQKRSDTKKNDPGKFTTTVSGHVSSGQNYLEAAVRETVEESGIEVSAEDLIHLGTVRADYIQGEYLSYAVRGLFAYKFTGSVNDLQVEDDEGAGFSALTFEELENLLASQPEKFAMVFNDTVGREFITGVKNLLNN